MVKYISIVLVGIFILPNTIIAQNIHPDKQVILSFINKMRVDGCTCGQQYYPPVPQVKWNDTLALIGLRHSLDMVKNNYFSHTSLAGTDVNYRSEQMGYSSYAIGENLAQGYNNSLEVMKAWLASPKHCLIMMIKDFKEIGVGVVGDTWTMVLGARKKKIS